MKSITDNQALKGKYILLRASLNVPLENGRVVNTFRLRQALPTLEYLQSAGARVIILAHIGRNPEASLLPVYEALATMIDIRWGGLITDKNFAKLQSAMIDGDILLLENIRQDKREQSNSPALAKSIASYGDIYVNDAFANIHRDHTTMVALPKLLPAYAGINLMTEVTNVTKVMTPNSPSLFILGGAKFETKMPLLHKYIDKYDMVFVGGALANDIIFGLGYGVGDSLRSTMTLNGTSLLTNPKLILPIDVLVVDELNNQRNCSITEVGPNEIIIDIGPATVAKLASYIKNSQTILWNGPLGKYEKGKLGSTHAVAKLIAQSDAYSVLGGGDTIATVEELGLNDAFGFVSTGGGAMLTLLEEGTTPALEALGYKSL